MVSLGAGSDAYEPWSAVLIGSVASLVYRGISRLMLKFCLDDPLDAVAVHLGGGLVGVISVHLFSFEEGILLKGDTLEPWKQFGVNLLGIFVIVAWSGIWAFVIFLSLRSCRCLRVTVDEEDNGIDEVSFFFFKIFLNRHKSIFTAFARRNCLPKRFKNRKSILGFETHRCDFSSFRKSQQSKI